MLTTGDLFRSPSSGGSKIELHTTVQPPEITCKGSDAKGPDSFVHGKSRHCHPFSLSFTNGNANGTTYTAENVVLSSISPLFSMINRV